MMKKCWNWARDETSPDARVLRLEGTIAEEDVYKRQLHLLGSPPEGAGHPRRAQARSAILSLSLIHI